MRRREVLKMMGAASLAVVPRRPMQAQPASAGKYQADWASLDARPIPSWYTEAKFGIFIHWGVYSVPSFAAVKVKDENPYAEWYWHSLTDGMDTKDTIGNGASTWEFHKRVYGPNFSYFEFAPMFRAEFFDPDVWADLFVRSGAKYVALTSKHHEGFTLWRSIEANRSWKRAWNSVDLGPKRDLVLDLTEAGRRKGLQMGIYYSLYEWYNPLWLSDKEKYVTEHLIPQFKDIVTHVKPAIIFSDGEWELTSAQWHSPEILAWLYNDSPVKDSVVVDDRWGSETRHKHGGYYTTEYTSGMQGATHPWEESRGMGYSYGYNRNETLKDYHTGRQLVLMLIDIVSRGGNLLLDIGPRADGHIPVVMEERLIQIGDWLRSNGEAIYGTEAWVRPAQWSSGNIPHLEQKDFMAEYDITNLVDEPKPGYARVDAFFTAKGNAVYAILPRWPEREFTLRKVNSGASTQVTLLGTDQKLQSRTTGNNIVIELPVQLRASTPQQEAYVLKIEGLPKQS